MRRLLLLLPLTLLLVVTVESSSSPANLTIPLFTCGPLDTLTLSYHRRLFNTLLIAINDSYSEGLFPPDYKVEGQLVSLSSGIIACLQEVHNVVYQLNAPVVIGPNVEGASTLSTAANTISVAMADTNVDLSDSPYMLSPKPSRNSEMDTIVNYCLSLGWNKLSIIAGVDSAGKRARLVSLDIDFYFLGFH